MATLRQAEFPERRIVGVRPNGEGGRGMSKHWGDVSNSVEHHVVAFSEAAGEDGWDVLTAQLDRTPDKQWADAFRDAVAPDFSYGCPPPELHGDTIVLRMPASNHDAGHVAVRVQVTLANTRLRVRTTPVS